MKKKVLLKNSNKEKKKKKKYRLLVINDIIKEKLKIKYIIKIKNIYIKQNKLYISYIT